MALSVTVWPQYTFVTNRQTDRHTHGHDDSNSDPLLTVTVAKNHSPNKVATSVMLLATVFFPNGSLNMLFS